MHEDGFPVRNGTEHRRSRNTLTDLSAPLVPLIAGNEADFVLSCVLQLASDGNHVRCMSLSQEPPSVEEFLEIYDTPVNTLFDEDIVYPMAHPTYV